MFLDMYPYSVGTLRSTPILELTGSTRQEVSSFITAFRPCNFVKNELTSWRVEYSDALITWPVASCPPRSGSKRMALATASLVMSSQVVTIVTLNLKRPWHLLDS